MNRIFNKKLVVLIFACMIMCFTSLNNEVFGLNVNVDVNSSTSANPDSCSDGNCMSLGTGGVRISLLDSEGRKVQNSIDLWYYNDSLKLFSFGSASYVSFKSKYTRQEIKNLGTDDNIDDKLEIYHSKSLSSIDNLSSGLIDDFSNSYTKNDGYIKSTERKNTRTPNSTYTIVKKLYSKIVDESKNNRYTTLDQILHLIDIEEDGKEDGLDHNDVREYYLEFEPLVSWGNTFLAHGENANIDANIVFVGTVSELTYMYQLNLKHKVTIFCSQRNVVSFKGADIYCTNDEGDATYRGAFNEINMDSNNSAFYSIAGMGVYTNDSSVFPNGLFDAVVNDYSNKVIGYAPGKAYKSAFGVAFISLEGLIGSCDDDFQNLLGAKNSYFTADGGVESNKLKNYINNNKNNYKGLIDDCANVDSKGNVTSFKSSCPLLFNLNKLSVALGSGVNTNNYGCKSDIECDTTLINAITKKFDTIITRIREKIIVDGNENYVDNNSYYKALISWLKILFPKQARLNDSVWATLGDSGPSCKPVPDCPGTSAELSCSDTNKMISSNNDPSCIKQGILYTLKSGNEVTDLKSSLNTSYTDECDNCKVYCSESVSFDLSGQKELDVKITEAGTLLKWGRGNNSQIFGTMTVKQTCYVVPNNGYTIGVNAGLKSKTIRSHLGSPLAIDDKKSSGRYVNTKVTIDYTNPASYLKDSNDKLDQKVTLVAIPTTRGVLSIKHQGSASLVDADKDSPISLIEPSTTALNYATTYSDDNHKKVESFDVIANYVFAYGEYSGCTKYDKDGNCIDTANVNGGVDGKSELAWYASKADNGSYKTQKEYEEASSVEKNSYVFIGYGLPTPFTSVTCIYDSENMSNNNSNRDKAPITVTIQNIGTSKNVASSDDSNDYQFTKLLGNEKKLSYSCNYKVHNQMFGYENGDSIDCDYTSPKGLDVVFRTIELVDTDGDKEEQLNKAFPGMSGKGVIGEESTRQMGANWEEWIDGNPDIVEDKANNIYNILSNIIYSKEPQYHIVLNVSTIKKIREYNKSARKTTDPYSNMPSVDGKENNGYIGYVCDNDDQTGYKFCASNFLTQLRSDSSIEFTGRCISSNYGSEGSKSRALAFTHASNGCLQHWW